MRWHARVLEKSKVWVHHRIRNQNVTWKQKLLQQVVSKHMNYFSLKSHKSLKESLVIGIRSMELFQFSEMCCLRQTTSAFQVKSMPFLLLFLFLTHNSPFCFENKTILAFSMFPPPPNLYKQVGFAHFEMHTSPTHTLIMCRNKDAHTP